MRLSPAWRTSVTLNRKHFAWIEFDVSIRPRALKSFNVFIHLGPINCNSFSTVLVRFLVEYTCHGDALYYYNEVSSLTDEDQDVCCGVKGEVKQFLRIRSQHESTAQPILTWCFCFQMAKKMTQLLTQESLSIKW
jgi:hypothetical protein